MISILEVRQTIEPNSSREDIPRVEGHLKVTGQAKYTSDIVLPGMLYAVPVGSTVAAGRIASIDVSRSAAMAGVKAVYTRDTMGPLYRVPSAKGVMGHIEEVRPALEDDTIHYYGQYVALVVASTIEQATAAADVVHVTYEIDTFNVSPELEFSSVAKIRSLRGDPESSFASAPVQLDQVYGTPAQTHNPIELHATVAVWEGDAVTLYETSQGIVNHRLILAQTLGVSLERVRVISHFLGSGFGSKLFPWSHSALAADAARRLGTPVKLVLDRQTMFHCVGHRSQTKQRLRIGADREGKLLSLQHDFVSHGSMLDDYLEDCGRATPFLYDVANLMVRSDLARRNVGTPTTMRGPGAVPGVFAIESAMDEMAVRLNMDPVQLRLLNEPGIDQSRNVPFSSRHMRECLQIGAKQFGWEGRNSQVGSMQRDGLIIGWGMAACAWDALRFDAEATVELLADGTARVSTATQDIGTGTYTILAQIVTEMTGLSRDRIAVSLGDTILPPGPTSGGSRGTASLIPAVCEATRNAIKVVTEAAVSGASPFFPGSTAADLAFNGGNVLLKKHTSPIVIPYTEILKQARLFTASGHGRSDGIQGSGEREKYSIHSYGAHFCEVTWQPNTARLRVSRFLSVIDAGRVINPTPARNQIEGAVVMGVGMALFEETMYDSKYGAPLNSNLADYMLTTNADAPQIEVTFLDYPDTALNELGARGLGEIGAVGSAAAVTAAVYHATGVRIRKLPIRLEELLVANLED